MLKLSQKIRLIKKINLNLIFYISPFIFIIYAKNRILILVSNDYTNELILERSKSVSPISTTSTSLLESSPPGSVKEKSHQSPNSKRKSNKKKKDQHEKFSAQLSDQLNSINLINIKNLLQTQLLQV